MPAIVLNEPWTVQTLVASLGERGERPAVIEARKAASVTWNYADLARDTDQLARGLRAAGVRKREPVGICAPNCAEWIIAWLAIAGAGAIAVPLDDQFPEPELVAAVKASGCVRIFTTRDHIAAFGRDATELYLLDGPKAGDDRAADWRTLLLPGAALPSVKPDDPATLMFTSGTTGPSKSFFLSHANIGANVTALVAENLISPEDGILLPLPLNHAYPLVVGVLAPLTTGAPVILSEQTSAEGLRRALHGPEVSVIVGVPRLYDAMLAAVDSAAAARGGLATFGLHRLIDVSIWLRRRLGLNVGRDLFRSLRRRVAPNLRLLVSGGAHLEANTTRRLEGLGWDVLSGYGLAETASLFTGNRPGAKRIGSEGLPLAGGKVKIAEPDADGLGEILLRGPNVFARYRKNVSANRAAFTDDGWFCTGDLGRLDEDGYLYVAGRTKEVIVLGGGKKVSPERLEAIYGQSPFVSEIAVLARDGKLVALVLPDKAAIRAAGAARPDDTIRVELAQRGQDLPSYQQLAGFRLTGANLPRTRLGKYKRYLLPSIYDRTETDKSAKDPTALSAEDRALLARKPAGDIWRFMRRRFGAATLSPDSSLQFDLGLDSLDALSLSMELRQRFAVDMADEDIADAGTVRELLMKAQAAPVVVEGPSPTSAQQGETEALGRRGPVLWTLARILYGLNWLLIRAFFRLKVDGADHLPAHPPFVIAANHASDLDPLAIAAALPIRVARRAYWAGDARRLFSTGLSRLFARAARIFPADERRPGATLAAASAVLKRCDALVWFPEAWRSPTGELQPFQEGLGKLLTETPVPVVPVRIQGTFAALPRTRRVPRLRKVTVAFEVPLDPRDLEQAGKGATPQARVTDGLYKHFAASGNRAKAQAKSC